VLKWNAKVLKLSAKWQDAYQKCPMGPTNPIPKELAVATLLQSVFSGFLSTTCQSNHLPIWSIQNSLIQNPQHYL
jgi:hypothetical protein